MYNLVGAYCPLARPSSPHLPVAQYSDERHYNCTLAADNAVHVIA
jgi:hypothetical protein